ncbi:MAG: trypsin-like peptidase domain-containing protein [Planctomycetes bacterium]|nr:trypsin-like peptidase domain-containing protein [Planctomycetota bacterium]
MRRTRRLGRVFLEGSKVLLLFLVFSVLQEQITGVRHDLLGSRSRTAEAEARRGEDLGEAREVLEASLAECAFEISRVRGDLERSACELASEREDLVRLIDARTRDLQGAVLGGMELERSAFERSRRDLEARAAGLERLQTATERDPLDMKRRMVYPTVQLKGNGTVGSGVIVYSMAQPDLGPGMEGVHATFVLTAYHVILEVLGDRLSSGTIDEVQVISESRPESPATHSAKLVLFDRARDMALLRLNTTRRLEQVAELLPGKDLASLDVFSRAYAVGCPLGNRPLPTLGEISSKSKVVAGQVFWMLSAPTFFGNSGGGVYQAETFRLIGISSMIYTYGKTHPAVVPHLGLFVPLATIYRWLEEEGYSFLCARAPIPPEMLWKLAYVEGGGAAPKASAGKAEE